jgi:hypothetical protein
MTRLTLSSLILCASLSCASPVEPVSPPQLLIDGAADAWVEPCNPEIVVWLSPTLSMDGCGGLIVTYIQPRAPE